jgi:hypothetical protein
VCVCVYIHIHTYTHAYTHTHTHTTHTHTHTHIQGAKSAVNFAETGADRGLVGADCPDPRVGSSPLGLRFRKVPKPGMHPEGFSPYVMRPRQVPVPNYYRTSTELLPNCYQLLPPPSPPPSSLASSFFARRDSEVARGLNLTTQVTIAACLAQTSAQGLKNAKHIARLSRPQILQDRTPRFAASLPHPPRRPTPTRASSSTLH